MDNLQSPLFRKNWFESEIKDHPEDKEVLQNRILEDNPCSHSNIYANLPKTFQIERIRKLSTEFPFKLPVENVVSKIIPIKFNTNLTKVANNSPSIGIEFNLETDGKKYLYETRELSEGDKRKCLALLNIKYRRIPDFTKEACLNRYKIKKNRRRHVCQIKYKIRQDLASKRLRVKGKFVKSNKGEENSFQKKINNGLSKKLKEGINLEIKIKTEVDIISEHLDITNHEYHNNDDNNSLTDGLFLK